MFELKSSGLYTLSFGFLDDLRLKTNLTFYFDDHDELQDILNFIVDCAFCKNNRKSVERLKDESYRNLVKDYVEKNKIEDMHDGYFFSDDEYQQYNKNDYIKDALESKKFYVENQWNKYYVFAYSIDYTRFNVYSKMCQGELIEWRTEGEEEKGDIVIDSDNGSWRY
jgi:hypothetical protein